MPQVTITRHPQTTAIPVVGNWVFQHPDTGDVWNIDAIAGTYTCYGEDGAVLASGSIDMVLASALCRTTYAMQHPDEAGN